MTLSTNIRVVQKTDPAELHAWINKNLLKAPNAKFTEGGDPDAGSLNNDPGQGYSAWLSMRWDSNGIPTARETYPEDYDATSTYGLDEPKNAFLNINFDTAYGYHGDLGEGCTELHSRFVIDLAKEYFEPRGLDFYWQDEYSGKWYHGLDTQGFNAFLGSGEGAMDWFNNTVVPVITAEAAAEGKGIEWL